MRTCPQNLISHLLPHWPQSAHEKESVFCEISQMEMNQVGTKNDSGFLICDKKIITSTPCTTFGLTKTKRKDKTTPVL